ncbi:hypothetical protein [Pseudidiomarina aestuarii]|uniref:hypothetical protein n=1 Tax=Pseudidiomarina aestuarii TaxID=624146 RepID=UPI003A9735BA
MMHHYMRAANRGDNAYDPHPCMVEVKNSNLQLCSDFLQHAQKRKKGMPNIHFSVALNTIYRCISDNIEPNTSDVYHVIFKRRRIYRGKSALGGHTVRLLFFIYDGRDKSLFFTGFLRTRIRESWQTLSNQEIQDGISIVKDGQICPPTLEVLRPPNTESSGRIV